LQSWWLQADTADIVHHSSTSENSPSSLVVYNAAKNKSPETDMLPLISKKPNDRLPSVAIDRGDLRNPRKE
jgi:hypothetical protein